VSRPRLRWARWGRATLVEQINRFDLETFQRSLNHLFDVLWTTAPPSCAGKFVRSAQIETEFGGNDYFVANRCERLTHQFFVSERAMGFGSVEKRHARFHRLPDQGNHVLFVGRWAETKTHAHAAESDGRDF